MEKKDWEQRLEDFYFEREKILPSQSVGIDIDDWKEFISQELEKAREEGYEKDIASDFLYWHPLGGGMPNSSIRIGVEFEVGGCHEDWGFVIEQNGKTISSGRTLKEAIDKLSGYTVGKILPKNMKGYQRRRKKIEI